MVSKNVLDNLKLIKKLDRADMLRHLLDFPSQCKEARRIGKSVKLPRRYSSFDNIVLSGLGGSAIGADLVRSYCWDHFKKPLYVNRNYTLPGFVDNNTVLFCMSYSGNTEETLSAYNEGKKKGAKRIVLTSGGKLKELAKKDKVPYIMIPGGLPPRAALGYSFFPLLYAVLKVAR